MTLPEYIDNPVLYETIDFMTICENPVKAILILRSEIALFQGVNNKSDEYIETIMRGIEYSTEVLPDFLSKTVGGKEKVEGLFINFNNVFLQTSKELKYFGPLLLSDDSIDKLNDYIKNPDDIDVEISFLQSLSDILKGSEDKIKNDLDVINKFVAQAITKL